MIRLNTQYVLIAGAIIIILAIIISWRIYYLRKRSEALGQLAQTMNFVFSPKGDGKLLESFNGFNVFSRGRVRKISNILSGKVNDISVRVFDYQYTTGGGDSSHTWRQTVLVLESEKLRLPDFVLRPEGLLDKIGVVLGYQDIDFDLYPKFSRQYFLRGKDQESVKAFFTDSLIQYYEQHAGLSTEGRGSRFICYYGGKVIQSDRIQEFMQQGYELFNMLKH
jgi:hypothetical protein